MKSSEKSGQTGKPSFALNPIQNVPQVGPNWVVILGGAIVSVLSVKLGHKLKQAVVSNRQRDDAKTLNEPEGKSATQGTLGVRPLHSNLCCRKLNGVVCNHFVTGSSDGTVEMKLGPQDAIRQCENESSHTLSMLQCKLSEIRVPCDSREYIPSCESPEQLELSNGHVHQSNSSESVCTSETGSEVYAKRNVTHRLRQQVKRRDELILEMQAQISYQQQTITNQMSHMANLQSQLDAANRDLFGAEREIQRLRKAIADHCAGHVVDMSCSPGTMTSNYRLLDHSINRSIDDVYGLTVGDVELWNGGTQRLQEQKLQGQMFDLRTSDVNAWKIGEDLQSDRNEEKATYEYTVESAKDLKMELAELKHLINGKNYLLEAYERQRVELCSQLKELQLKLGTQVASIL